MSKKISFSNKLTKVLLIITLILTIITFIVPFVSATSCGDTIVADTTLTGNMTGCAGDGLIFGANDITLDCDGYSITGAPSISNGISLIGITNATIKNCNINLFNLGVYMQSSSNSYLLNNTVNSNSVYGIYLWTSNDNILDGNTANSNIYHGIYIWQSSGNIVENSVTNLNGYFGIILSEAGNSILYHNTANTNTESGILISTVSNNNIISNNIADYNINSGLYLTVSSDNNIITDNIFNSNSIYGIALTGINNTIKNNIITSNGANGMALGDSTLGRIYNNFFNNTNNVDIGISSPNNWNRTKLAGINIINGGFLAGNYWAEPSGNGFSQTCTNVNGICSDNYTLGADNIDWLPLASSSNYIPINISKLVQLTSISKQNTDADIKIACFDGNNNYCTIAAICKLTILYPNSSVMVNDQQMNFNPSFYNYPLNASQISASGPYSITVVCSSTNSENINWIDTVTPTGKQFALSDVFVYLFFLAICLTVTVLSFRLTNDHSMQKDQMSSSQLYQMKKKHETQFYWEMLKRKMWIVGVFGIYLSVLTFLVFMSQLIFNLGISEINSLLTPVITILSWGLIPFMIFWLVYMIMYFYRATENIMKYQFGSIGGGK